MIFQSIKGNPAKWSNRYWFNFLFLPSPCTCSLLQKFHPEPMCCFSLLLSHIFQLFYYFVIGFFSLQGWEHSSICRRQHAQQGESSPSLVFYLHFLFSLPPRTSCRPRTLANSSP